MDTNQYETRDSIKEDIIHSYDYGSSVYKSMTKESDYDFIFIVKSDNENLYYSVSNENGDATVYSEQRFIQRIKDHHISALECIFQRPRTDKYYRMFELNLEKLRREISAVSSNSFIKCKKKLKIGEDYIGKKSMFHSLRILMFGIQIARYGKIVDYSCANYLLPIIMSMNTWEEIQAFCQPIYNSLKSMFKILAPLESDRVA